MYINSISSAPISKKAFSEYIPAKTADPESYQSNFSDVSISAEGQSRIERELQNMASAKASNELIDFRGREGQIRLGLIALGQNQISQWQEQGLELSEETILAAAATFNDAFQSMQALTGSDAGSFALNKHQIVMNSQNVPDWFVEEYQQQIEMMGASDTANAFKQGELYSVAEINKIQQQPMKQFLSVQYS